jgi:hypothetical protein
MALGWPAVALAPYNASAIARCSAAVKRLEDPSASDEGLQLVRPEARGAGENAAYRMKRQAYDSSEGLRALPDCSHHDLSEALRALPDCSVKPRINPLPVAHQAFHIMFCMNRCP